jgi:predicted dinucleotide-binding enzyme
MPLSWADRARHQQSFRGRDGATARHREGRRGRHRRIPGGHRVVRAFNRIPAASLANDGNRTPERIRSDGRRRRRRSPWRLVRDAGFDPVVVGTLAQTRQFDLGAPLASRQYTAAEMRKALGR